MKEPTVTGKGYGPLIKTLHELFSKYPFEKKVLILPSYIDGNALRKTISRQGLNVLNVHQMTLFDLARRFSLHEIIQKKLHILDHSLGLVIIMQILKQLSAEKALRYFQLPLITPGLARTVFRTIKEIRAAGYLSQNWLSRISPDSGKMQDLYRVMAEYEKQLEVKGLIDEARLYLLAADTTYREDETIFLIPANLQMNPVEQLFFNRTIKSAARILEMPCPEAAIAPYSYPLAGLAHHGTGPEEAVLGFLNHEKSTDTDLPEPQLAFFRAHGEYAEVREVLRRILEDGIPFGQTQILYTSQEPYTQYFYQLLHSGYDSADLGDQKIPVTYHSGIHIKNSAPGKLFFDLLEWMNDNYSIKRLFTLLNSGTINLHLPQSFTMDSFASLLRSSPIGWGRERYLPGILLAVKEREKKLEHSSAEQRQCYQTEIKTYRLIQDWIEKVFRLLPDGGFESRVSLGVLAGGISQFIQDFSVIEDHQLDEEALSVITQNMRILERNVTEEMTCGEALTILGDALRNVYVCCSEPCSGKLHIASYKKGIWMDRPYTFIVGMDSHRFPGNTDDGTVFLESEKKPYRHLLTDSEKSRMEQMRFLHLILSLKGRKVCSYSCSDSLHDQEQPPSLMLLQCYRLVQKNPGKSYDEFYQDLGDKKRLIPENNAAFLDDGDIFLYLAHQEKRDLQSLFLEKYMHLIQGLKADLVRRKGDFNAYNGRVRVTAQKIDPRRNRGIVMSSSRLERIAVCPYLYFLSDVLKIKPPEEMEYEPVQWLNPLERGLLLHQIYEDFYRSLKNISPDHFEAPSFARHWKMLKNIAQRRMEEKKRFLAPPGDLIYQAEKREILESCQMFLIGEEKNYKGQVPQYFELAFGTRDNEHDTLGKVKSIELDLPSGEKVSFQGKIDRIDRMPDGTFQVIDYKTGSYRDYKKGKPFRYGQQLQHALYAIALEKILGKKFTAEKPVVSASGYSFPTIRGQGNLVLYEQKNSALALQIVEILLDIITQGSFAMTQDAEHFMCRNYQDIMEQNDIISVDGKPKEEEAAHEPALDGLRRLKQYE